MTNDPALAFALSIVHDALVVLVQTLTSPWVLPFTVLGLVSLVAVQFIERGDRVEESIVLTERTENIGAN